MMRAMDGHPENGFASTECNLERLLIPEIRHDNFDSLAMSALLPAESRVREMPRGVYRPSARTASSTADPMKSRLSWCEQRTRIGLHAPWAPVAPKIVMTGMIFW
jgi:hypothetical protein